METKRTSTYGGHDIAASSVAGLQQPHRRCVGRKQAHSLADSLASKVVRSRYLPGEMPVWSATGGLPVSVNRLTVPAPTSRCRAAAMRTLSLLLTAAWAAHEQSVCKLMSPDVSNRGEHCPRLGLDRDPALVCAPALTRTIKKVNCGLRVGITAAELGLCT